MSLELLFLIHHHHIPVDLILQQHTYICIIFLLEKMRSTNMEAR
jgi:hypothetical protein